MLTIPQIIKRLENGESCDAIMVTHKSRSSTILYYTETKGPIKSFMVSSAYVKGLLKWKIMKQPKLVKMDVKLYKWFTAMCSKGTPMTSPVRT
jgi:hypothetical protein